MRWLYRLLAAALAAFASASVLAFAAAPARAQVPSMEGEIFIGVNVEVVGVCDPSGTSTITFRAEGMAAGPYSGTFVEEGTITLLGTSVLSFDATFTIFAVTGEQVTGRKTLTRDLFAACDLALVGADALVSYEATIKTTSGSFRDTGKARATVHGFLCDPSCIIAESFYEEFLLSTGLLPVFTTGKATGGGQFLRTATTQERVSFGFEVKSTEDPSRLQGRCLVLDRARDTQVKCLDARNYEEFANTATWEGTAEVNGVREDYKITVQDNGEPNQGLDTFAIDTESYDAAGPVERGNVQIHKQQGAL